MIPESEWHWCGVAGHLAVASKCRFHLHTRVGDFRVSTVGDWRPDYEEGPKEIGAGRLYETYVFPVEDPGECPAGVVTGWVEVDSEAYNDPVEAEEGHMRMCRKYAEEQT